MESSKKIYLMFSAEGTFKKSHLMFLKCLLSICFDRCLCYGEQKQEKFLDS